MNPPPSTTTLPPDDPRASLRRGVYALLIALSVGSMTGRILAVNSVDVIGLEKNLLEHEIKRRKDELTKLGQAIDETTVEREARAKVAKQRPFLSSNDRSRWATIRSLVEHGTFAIDDVVAEPNWDTIDMVRHDSAGRSEAAAPDPSDLHFYSSKPTLLTVIVAGEYWVIHRLTGATLGDHPYEIGRMMLITLNVAPLLVYFLLLAGLAERYGRTDWGRIFVMAAATFGTFITTFAVVLNNHVTGAITTLGVIYLATRIWYDGRREPWYFAVAGLMAAFTASDELPALSFFALLTAGLLWKARRQTLVAYLPASLVVVVAFFGTNYAAHHSWRPPYMHRSATDPADNWYKFTYRGKPSYWSAPNNPIDQGEESAAVYALHALVGHHGIFSLTPVWLLAVPGLLMLGWGRDYRLRDLAILIGTVTVVCVSFYLFVVQKLDRNYGGMTSGLRWVFWMAPMWLIAMLPAADWFSATRVRRGIAYVFIGLSALSASYPIWNPWTQPWLTNFFTYLGWTRY